ncbi:MAG: hypothetical protein COB23_05315 [Methylophaga sp.]|nr:MAG: hypothetical protein COB23_05315 [Methylophaga sp.]
MKSIHLPVISVKSRANIYWQLCQLEQTGFSAQQAFGLLQQTDKKTAKNIQQLQKYLQQGKSIAESGFKAGIFGLFDKGLVLVGEESGQLGTIYQQLAEYYANKTKRMKYIKSKLYLPLVLLILAIFIQPLPSLIATEITGLVYLARTIGLLFKITLGLYIIYTLSKWLTYSRLQYFGFGQLFSTLQIKLPIMAKWVISRQINDFIYSLGLMLSAGLPMLYALPKAVATIKNRVLRSQFSLTASSIEQGNSLTETLSHIPAINNEIIYQLRIGENSGSLAQTMLHFTKIEAEKINMQENLLAEWIPRVIYLAIIITMAFSIIGSHPFGLISV